MSEPKPKFVVLHHEMPAHSDRPSHFDLMLEDGEVLLTWALEEQPSSDRAKTGIACAALPDHRKLYLDYEGPVSEDRGNVVRIDRGCYQLHSRNDDRIKFELFGKVLRDCYELELLDAEAQAWVFRKT